MKNIFFLSIFFLILYGYAQNNTFNKEQIENINQLIKLFNEIDIDKISEKIQYPLQRKTPIPNIKNQTEFKQQFDEIFDPTLIKQIANSKIEQWSEVGWRGIMLDNGLIWLDGDGENIIAINYETEKEIQLRKRLINKQKLALYPSLRNFKNPMYRIQTEKYLIRIDELSNGKYRYTSWKTNQNEASKPDIILNKGTIEYDGSGGNHSFTFLNGIYTYIVSIHLIHSGNAPDSTLEVMKGTKNILSQSGKILTH
ncbi:hypothetical protein [Capnocytophaga catalasegens]|uniref:Uncharacterized protein n=1 Tax=Capnocytophaga catalasegens TaxID=1004260 RepID=A0AAV5AX32_9FLAO|nr:hypothetical protein [Capnocytophaga catalasegens]GIZ15855.1 hypothetical protein RCZ03_18550 [Capnocytophaga catalasegens]GJM49222.1 hypothetical protein RCZ15_01970 [Capnocytophaga catalasegens]GJM53135.1 hypothetical protein RCZ16_14520 [Capnocytophaga catalasegens]